MRKLIVSMNLSLDGYMSGPRGELDWHFESWSEEMAEKLLGLLDITDTILLGRVTYEAMSKYWSFRPLDPGFPRQDQAIADKMNRHKKIVFSGRPLNTFWANTKMASLDLTQEIRQLRKEPGKNILLFGSCKLVSAIIASDLADEYRLWIHPVLLGKGKPLFNDQKKIMRLKLSGSAILKSGIVLLQLLPVI